MTGWLPNPWWREHAAELWARIAEHLFLTGLATGLALLLGLAIAIGAFRFPRLRATLLTLVNLVQTIPGMALLVMMLALFQRIGMLPALAALVLYALLPIVRGTLTGLLSVPPPLAEAAQALGMHARQRLWHLRLPMAMPALISGLRTAAVQCVGLATLAAFVGAGGLGQFINRGLFLSDTRLVLLGAVPAALIALLTDAAIGLLQFGFLARQAPLPRRHMARAAAMALLLGMLVLVVMFLPRQSESLRPVVIGSKNFTEQLIVAEIVAQRLEAAGMPVARRFGLGGTAVLHRALTDGAVDVAVEYSGTALASVLGLPVPANPADTFGQVHDAYARRFGLVWLPPLGFNNSYVLAVRRDDARLRAVTTLSQLAALSAGLRAGFDFEFAERPDGYTGLKRAYGLDFAQPRDIHPDMLYTILARGEVDVISAYATDGRLIAHDFKLLADDRRFFPPYDAAVVVRRDSLARMPGLEAQLRSLSGRLPDSVMRALNAQVDAEGRSPQEVARAFLAGLEAK